MRSLIAAVFLVAAGPVSAQTSDWTFALSPYAWVPGVATSITTDAGTVDIDSSSSDALSNLDLALMGAFEARNGKWGLILDGLYVDLTNTEKTPLGLFYEEGEVNTRMSAVTVYAAYRALETDNGAIDLLGGGRYFSLDVDLKLKGAALPSENYDLSSNWADPVFGLRGRYNFTDKWFATALLDAGGFGGGSDSSWQAFGSVGYQFSPTWSVQGGWRYLAVEKEISGRNVEVDLSGPIFGFTARF